MRITAVKRQKKHSDRVNVEIDGEFRCGLAADIAYAVPLRKGDEIDEATLERLEREDEHWKAREAAYRLLSHRARTETELRRRLYKKDFPEAVVESCVSELREKGLVDDEDFAAMFVRDRLRLKPRGSRRLVQELSAKGVDRDTAERVIDETFRDQNVSELGLARDVADDWAQRNLPRAAVEDGDGLEGDALWSARRRLYGYLGRRGFGGDVTHRVMDAVLG